MNRTMNRTIRILSLSVVFLSIGCSNSQVPQSPEGNLSDDIDVNVNTRDVDNLDTVDTVVDDEVELGLPPSLINRDNYQDLLAQAFEIYFGTAYDQRLPTNHMDRLIQGEPIRAREEVDGFATSLFATFACSNGGTVERRAVVGISPVISYGHNTSNCQYGTDVVTGTVDFESYRDTTHNNISVTDFQVEFGVDDWVKANGMYRRFHKFYGYGANPYDWTEQWRTEEFNYDVSYLGNGLRVDNATTLGWYGYTSKIQENSEHSWVYHAHMEGNFTMNSSKIAAGEIAVSTPQIFTQKYLAPFDIENQYQAPYQTPPLPEFKEGTLLLLADDRSTLELQATGTEGDSPVVTITSSEGIGESFTVTWESLEAAMVLRDKMLEFPVQ